MKPNFYTFISILVCTVLTVPTAAQSKQSTDELLNDDWYAKAVSNIQQLENKFYPAQQPGVYRVANSTNRLGFVMTPKGYTAQSIRRQNGQDGWNVSFTIKSIGKNTDFRPMAT